MVSKNILLSMAAVFAVTVYAQEVKVQKVAVKETKTVTTKVDELKPAKKTKGFVVENDFAKLSISGKIDTKGSILWNGAYLNGNGPLANGSTDLASDPNDVVSEVRCTADTQIGLTFANNIKFNTEIRSRYIFGSYSAAKTIKDIPYSIAGISNPLPDANLNRNVIWVRQADMTIPVGLESSHAYVKLGMFPYELGRGISLGGEYIGNGFVGFNPSNTIDQYAPGLLLHTDLPYTHNRVSFDAYGALLENKADSYSNNIEKIYKNELLQPGDSQTTRGPSSQSWLVAGALHIKPVTKDSVKVSIDPYVMYRNAPNQKLEFEGDSASRLATFGTSMDFEIGKFSWGMETAVNAGKQVIRAWDRNYKQLAVDPATGNVIVQYSKVYTDNSSTPRVLQTATSAFDAYVNSNNAVDQNGQQIAGQALYNASDRFRPYQIKYYQGWFFVTDAQYVTADKQFTFGSEFGYVSGDLDTLEDSTTRSDEYLRNQKYLGFVPVHSVYTGKRVNHLIMLNVGVPRFAKYAYGQSVDSNTADAIGKETFPTSMTNIVYIGGSAEYKPKFLQDYNTTIGFNAIQYWSPVSPLKADKTVASSNVGLTLLLTVKTAIKEYLEVGAAFGTFIPGAQYNDMKGTVVAKGKIGNDNAYYASLGLACKF